MANELKYLRLSEHAFHLTQGSINSAGIDLSSAYSYVIPPKGKEIKTDIAIKLPDKCYGRIAPRFGLALEFIDVGAGVFDPDYGGDLRVLLFNCGDKEFVVKRGMNIAQLICEQYVSAKLVD